MRKYFSLNILSVKKTHLSLRTLNERLKDDISI